MSRVQMVSDQVDKNTDRVIDCIPEAIRQLKERKGIKDPVAPSARFTNRFHQPTPYEDDGSTGPIMSQAPLISVSASCGNLEHRGYWICKGCRKPAGLCRYCLMLSVRQRYHQLHVSGWKCIYAGQGKVHARKPNLYRTSKPIVLDHCDSRPIICKNERQVEWELRQRGFRSQRGPGENV